MQLLRKAFRCPKYQFNVGEEVLFADESGERSAVVLSRHRFGLLVRVFGLLEPGLVKPGRNYYDLSFCDGALSVSNADEGSISVDSGLG